MIDHDAIYLHHGLPASPAQMEQVRADSAVNVFVVQQAGGSGSIGVIGYYDLGRDWIVIQRDQIRPGNRTLAHEVGHYFSLLHPHFGWDGAAWDSVLHGNPPGSLAPDGLTPVERVDGSNCQTAGDRLCDTPPDYNLGLDWQQSCTYAGGALDPAGQVLDPDERLIMSYFSESCRRDFSPEQRQLMRADYLSAARNALRTAPPDTLSTVAPVSDLLQPAPGGLTDWADSVQLRWSSVSGQAAYLVQVDRSPAFDLSPITRLTTESVCS
ncbi:MAG: hypothetical protein D6722_02965 [Bacteroidetes bacterium]|nr:MAG: hypothetical protein D6722_02965 [Bacteroidota bacterium]